MEEAENYTEAEAPEMLVHATKANQVCGRVRKNFNLCRSGPFGRVVDPRMCLNHAMNLIQCFHEVKNVPRRCAEEFAEVRDCVERRKTKEGLFSVAMCEGAMRNYASCEDPATSKWAEY